MGKFAALGLKSDIVAILKGLKLEESSEVQDVIIPRSMTGRNIVFTSMTGSGKTLAYSLGFLQKISSKQGTQMLVVVPTRELCLQVGRELQRVCTPLGLHVATYHGGHDIKADSRTLSRKNHIIVGTPGRLIMHINERKLTVGEVRFLVFDESDQMFDHGFDKDCAYVIKRVRKDCQVILASATITEKVEAFIEREMGNYELLRIGVKIPQCIWQEKVMCRIPDKPALLARFFSQRKFKRVIVFANKKANTYMIADFLTEKGFLAKPINSDLDQTQRDNHLNLFKTGKIAILVATDVASRGLHIPNVDIVVNYDVPTKEEFYVHRIGRCGRNGQVGYALTIVCPEDEDRIADIEFDYNIKVGLIGKDFNRIKVEES